MGQDWLTALGGSFAVADLVRRMPGRAVLRARRQAQRAWDAAMDVVYPRRCSFCGDEIEDAIHDVLLCSDCTHQMTTTEAACQTCGMAVAPGHTAEKCSRCEDRKLRFAAAIPLGPYDGRLRTAVLRMKRSAELPLATAVGRLLAEARQAPLRGFNCDVVVPIPMHWRRRLCRGVNSAEVLATQVARKLQLPAATHLLRRIRSTTPQFELAPSARAKNVRGAFSVHQHQDLPGARVLVVDDIMTTGATSSEAAAVLRRAGAAYVAVAVVARAAGV